VLRLLPPRVPFTKAVVAFGLDPVLSLFPEDLPDTPGYPAFQSTSLLPGSPSDKVLAGRTILRLWPWYAGQQIPKLVV